jgi:glycosyltransferase involved in cell wall biosynthesis
MSGGQRVPFWADLFGHVMAEAQARAFIDQDDGALFHYWNGEYAILSEGDSFSCVSGRQSDALIGELGAAGRLNRSSSGYEFTHVIPCGMPQEDFSHDKTVLRGMGRVSDKDFVVLWTGGYNTWTDIDTLFEALETAFSRDSSIFFVSTGGEIPEQDVVTYPRFLSLIEGSPFKDRFIMNGWIDGRDVKNYYFEADIGINIDRDIYEVRLGSKNRILDWMRAGLPTLSSNVCELTEIIAREGLGYTYRPHDPQDLASKILYVSKNRKGLAAIAKKAREYGKENFTFKKTAESLCEWARQPARSPDGDMPRRLLLDREESLRNYERIVSGQKEMIEQRDKRIAELESIVKKGLPFRAYTYLKILKRKTLKRWTS